MAMIPISRLLTLDHPAYDDVEYVVLAAGDRTFWYRVDLEDETWEFLPTS